MEYARRASELLVGLRREMNGAVAADMERRGLHYPRNYGVALHTIREAAKQIARDHDFAKYLWTQPVRELKLAAVTIANPAEVTAGEVGFWIEGAVNSELAENLASFLLSRTAQVRYILDAYTSSDNQIFVYTALMTGVRAFAEEFTAEDAIGYVERVAKHTPLTERASALLLSHSAAAGGKNAGRIERYVGELRGSTDPSRQRIAEETMI